jgi:hypothetical protein
MNMIFAARTPGTPEKRKFPEIAFPDVLAVDVILLGTVFHTHG